MIELRIVCFGCGTPHSWRTVSMRARTSSMTWLRSRAKLDGWLVGLRGGRDYCPKCKKERKS